MLKTTYIKMLKPTYIKLKQWCKNIFETRLDLCIATAAILLVLAGTLKITIFNHILVPQADKWMFRYKLLTTLPFVIICYPILFRFRSKALLITFYIAQTLYILMNMSYYLYYDNYLHIEQFISNFYEGSVAVLHAASPKNPLLLIALIDLPFFIFLASAYRRANRLWHKLKVPVRILVVIALLITAVSQYGHYKENVFVTQIAKNMFLGESRMVQRYGTLVNSAVSLYNLKDTQEYINDLQYGEEMINIQEAAEKPDIFIIQVESMDSAIVQQKHSDSYVMPYMHSLTQNSVYYPYVVSYHFGGGTSDCEFSVINSVEPIVGFPAIKLTTYDAPNSFIKQLNAASYEAYAFHGNIGRYYNRDLSFHKYGFKEYYDIAAMGMKDIGWGAPDEQVFDFALEKARAVKASDGSKPLLSYMITMTSHGPFTAVLNYYSNSAYDDVPDKLVKDYYNSMSYVDLCIQEYIQAIQREFNNAIILIMGDHTPKIESDIYTQSNVIIEDKNYEFVPLFIITPDGQKHREEHNAATFLDIAPTLLNAAGVPYAIRTAGDDLLDREDIIRKIPYRGLEWDRADLFEHIADKFAED